VNGPALLALQQLDTELEAIEGRRRRLPQRARLAEVTALHTTHTTERARLQAIVESAYTAIEQAEAAGAELDRKKARLDAQLKTVIAPREAEALMHEIAVIQGHHSELDDRELEAMDQQAQAESALAELALAEPTLLEQIAIAQAELDEMVTGLAAEEADVRARRLHADAVLDDSERDTYVTMLKRHQGVGFSRLERHTCTGCHVDLSQVEFERVMSVQPDGELPDCPHCGRYLIV
jgi:predicted  nucleic acid-binding Zn-ribbon protein